MAVVTAEDRPGSSADLLWRFQPTISNTLLQGFELGPYAAHRLGSLLALKSKTLFGVHHKHPNARLVRGHLLHQCLWWIPFFAGGDADRALDPRAGCAFDVVEHLSTTPPD